MLNDMNSACAQMTADIEAAFDVIGTAASEPSLLIDQLASDTYTDKGRGGCGVGASWSARAVQLIRSVTDRDQDALEHCAARAFDDPDARVRGLAWCLLAEIEDLPGLGESVEGAIVRGYMKRVVAPADRILRQDEAHGFAIMIGAITGGGWARQFAIEAEREYIGRNGGSDAWLIESSPASAIAFLTHADIGRRLAAIRVVARAGRSDRQACDAVYARITSDREADVRLAAIVAYGDMCRDTRDEQGLRRLAQLVLDVSLPVYHRFAAYCALVKVDGRSPKDGWPLLCADSEKLGRLRDGVCDDWPVWPDWDFVQRCVTGTGHVKGGM